MKNSIEQKIASLAKLHDCNGNILGRWFVFFSFRSPATGKMHRFKIYEGLAPAKTIEEKYRIGRALVQKINRKLRNGYNPFESNQSIFSSIPPAEPAKTVATITIQECLNNVIQEESLSIRKATIQAYQSQLRGLCKWLKANNLDSLEIQDFSIEHANRFLRHVLVELNLHTTTRNTYRTNLKRLFSLLKERNTIDINPFDKTKKVYSQKTSQKYYRAHQREQLKEFISRANPEMWLFIQFMCYCFIRPKELLGLTIDDVDLEQGKIQIRGTISKNKKTQFVRIPDVFLKILMKEGLHVSSGTLLLFGKHGKPGEKPRSKNHFNRNHAIILKALGYGKGYSLYSWKHTGAIMFYEENKNIKALQMQMRHHSLDQTNEYLKNLGVMDSEDLKSGFPEL